MFVATTSKNQAQHPAPTPRVVGTQAPPYCSLFHSRYPQVLVSDPATPYDVITEV